MLRGAASMTRILIADDHAVVRAGLRQFLEDSPGVGTLGEAGSAADVMRHLDAGSWDLLLLDINLPDRSGLDVLRLVRDAHPETRVLILSGYPEKQYALNVLRAGASGYLPKDCRPEELLQAIATVMGGRRYVSSELAEQLVSGMDTDSQQPLHTRLSEREFQILCKLATGLSASEIGRELSISVKTVSTYRSRILEKMALKTNADLTAYALRSGLVQ
jgi:two-component system, NarL family, invasion response regulator UvrY